MPNHYPPWGTFHSELFAFVGLAGLLLTLVRTGGLITIPIVSIALAGIGFIPWGQYLAGEVFFFGDAFISTPYLLVFALSIAIAYSWNSNAQSIGAHDILELTAKGVFAAALISAMLALLQWLSLTDFLGSFAVGIEPGERAGANLSQANQLGTLLVMGMGSAAVLYERRKIGLFTLGLGVAFMSWAMVLSESRTAVLSAFAVGGFLFFRIKSVNGRLSRKDVLAGLALVILARWLLPVANELLLFTAPRGNAFLDQTGRAEIWWQTLYAIQASPWWGYGWNQTPIAQAAGALKYPGTLYFTYSHNLFLDIFVWVGLPLGLIINGGLIYWFLSRLIRATFMRGVYAMGMLLPVAIHSLLEYPFAYAYFLLTAGLLIGVLEISTSGRSTSPLPRRSGWLAVSVLIIGISYYAYEYFLIEEDYRVARFEGLNVGRTPEDYKRPTIYINTQLDALLVVQRQHAEKNMTTRQLKDLQHVALRFGYRPLAYRYALALGLNGDAAGATEQMRLVRSMYGEKYYQSTKEDMLRLADTKYPELREVRLP